MMATFPTFSIADGQHELAFKPSGEGASAQGGFLSILSGLGGPGDEAAPEAAGANPAVIPTLALLGAMPKTALQADGEAEDESPAEEDPSGPAENEAAPSPDQPWAAMLGLPALFAPDGMPAPRIGGADEGAPGPAGTRAMLLATTMPIPGTVLPVEGDGSEGKASAAAASDSATALDAQPATAGVAKPELSLPTSLLKAALTPRAAKADAPVAAAGKAPVDGAPKLDVAVADMTRPMADVAPAFVSATMKPAEQTTLTLAPLSDIAGQMVEHHLDLAHESRWLDQLARDIAGAGSADGRLRFRLDPHHLGKLDVELRNGDGGTAIRLIADTEATRALLADAQPRLMAEARSQGVRIAEAHVDLGSGGQGYGHSMADQQREQRGTQGEAYLTTFKPKRADEAVAPSTARHAAELYA